MVVAQSAEWSLQTTEIRRLNPDIGKFLLRANLQMFCDLFKKTKRKKKRPGMAH